MTIPVKWKMPPPFMPMPYRGRKIRLQHGGSFWSGVWDAAKKGYNWIKDNKVATKIATAVGRPDVAGLRVNSVSVRQNVKLPCPNKWLVAKPKAKAHLEWLFCVSRKYE